MNTHHARPLILAIMAISLCTTLFADKVSVTQRAAQIKQIPQQVAASQASIKQQLAQTAQLATQQAAKGKTQVDNLYKIFKIYATKLFSPSPGYLTDSLYKSEVTDFFGTQGLNFPSELIEQIEKFYFFLEYTVHLELAGKVAQLAQQHNIDVLSTLETYKNKQPWSTLVAKVMKAEGTSSITALKTKLKSVTVWDNAGKLTVYQTNHANPWKGQTWQEIKESNFWETFAVTQNDIENSDTWQEYVDYRYIKLLESDDRHQRLILQSQKELYKYIPNIDFSYLNETFEHIRNTSDLYRISSKLSRDAQKRFLAQSNYFKNFRTNHNTIKPDYLKSPVIAGVKQPNPFEISINNYKKRPIYKAMIILEEHEHEVDKAASSTSKTTNKQTASQKTNAKLKKVPGAQKGVIKQQMMCITMIDILQKRISEYFQADTAQETMDTLKNLKGKELLPSIMRYTAEDETYLLYRSQISKEFPISAIKSSQAKINHIKVAQAAGAPGSRNDEKVSSQSLWSDATHIAIDFAKANETVDPLEFGQPNNLWSNPAGGLKHLRSDLHDARFQIDNISNKIVKFSHTLQNLQDKVDKWESGTMEKDIGSTLVTLINALPLESPDVGKEIGTSVSKIIGGVFLFATDEAFLGVESATLATGLTVKLTNDTAAFFTDMVVDSSLAVITGNKEYLASDIGFDVKTLARDTVYSLTKELSFIWYGTKKIFMDIFNTLGALVQFIVYDIIDGITEQIYAAGVVAQGLGLGTSLKNFSHTAHTGLDTQKHMLTQLVTNGALVAFSVAALVIEVATAEDGISVALIGPTLGVLGAASFGVLATIGGEQQDIAQIKRKQQQKIQFADFLKYIANNLYVVSSQEYSTINELGKRLKNIYTGQERQLGFYQNLLAQTVQRSQERAGKVAGKFQAQMLTTESVNNIAGDPGVIYGLKTNGIDLYPMGYSLYSAARDSFSQEIAAAPSVVRTRDSKGDIIELNRFWFNQKMLFEAPKSSTTEPLTVAFEFRSIYTLNNFHLGLLMGGKPLDKAAVLKTKMADPDRDHLAKMIVYKSSQGPSKATLGLYEHEGAKWIANNITAPKFANGTWYQLKATLDGTNLSVSVWEKGKTESSPQTYTVQQTDQTIFGIIYSGASLEWRFLNPQTLKPDNNAVITEIGQGSDKKAITRDDLPATNQADAELYQICGLQFNSSSFLGRSIKLGNFELEDTGLTEVLKEHYVYTSKQTKLPNSMQDYVIMLTTNIDPQSSMKDLDSGSISKAGRNIAIQDNATKNGQCRLIQAATDAAGNSTAQSGAQANTVLSLVSGLVFDINGKALTRIQNQDTFPLPATAGPALLDRYQAKYGNMNTSLQADIKKAHTDYVSALIKQANGIKFASWLTLKSASRDAFDRFQFIYSGPSPEIEFTHPADNATKVPSDYFVTVITEKNSLGNFTLSSDYNKSHGHLFDSTKTKHVISLVTGKLYGKKSSTAISNSSISISIDNLPTDLQKNIDDSKAFYKAEQAVELAKEKAEEAKEKAAAAAKKRKQDEVNKLSNSDTNLKADLAKKNIVLQGYKTSYAKTIKALSGQNLTDYNKILAAIKTKKAAIATGLAQGENSSKSFDVRTKAYAGVKKVIKAYKGKNTSLDNLLYKAQTSQAKAEKEFKPGYNNEVKEYNTYHDKLTTKVTGDSATYATTISGLTGDDKTTYKNKLDSITSLQPNINKYMLNKTGTSAGNTNLSAVQRQAALNKVITTADPNDLSIMIQYENNIDDLTSWLQTTKQNLNTSTQKQSNNDWGPPPPSNGGW